MAMWAVFAGRVRRVGQPRGLRLAAARPLVLMFTRLYRIRALRRAAKGIIEYIYLAVMRPLFARRAAARRKRKGANGVSPLDNANDE